VAKRKATELIEVEKAPFLVGGIVGFEGIAMAEVGCKNDVVVSFFGQNSTPTSRARARDGSSST
jgi:hypothetical protein